MSALHKAYYQFEKAARKVDKKELAVHRAEKALNRKLTEKGKLRARRKLKWRNRQLQKALEKLDSFRRKIRSIKETEKRVNSDKGKK